jgi:ribosomal protein L4
MPSISVVSAGRVTARAVMNADRVVATRTALEKLQEALA